MTQHQAKRPYGGSQPHITSYFNPSAASSSSASSLSQAHLQTHTSTSASPSSQPYSIAHPLPDHDSLSPPLPASIQSNLLSVGMRIRKSVPEGYKTGSEYSAFELFSDKSKSKASSHSSNPTSYTHSSTMETASSTPSSSPTRTRPRANASVRELLPFCGLLKVGGLNTQQWGIYNPQSSQAPWPRSASSREQDMAEDEDEDEVPFLSQGSTISSTSVTTPNGMKRRCEWEDSGEDENEDDNEIPVLHHGDFQKDNPFAFGERVLAVPRRRKYQGAAGVGGAVGAGKSSASLGQEHRVGIVGEDIDFGEAEFLDFAGFKGREVEMSGV